MAYKLTWDGPGERKYESGVDHGVLYLQKNRNSNEKPYDKGVAWNGLTSVSESPSGAEPNDFYADNIKYGSLRSAEEYGGTIECYTYPDEFKTCNGESELVKGVSIGQQSRDTFGFCYRSNIGNDEDQNFGYKLHLVYGATCSPSEVTHETINDSPDAGTMSFEFTTNPVSVTGYKPTAKITIDSTVLAPEKLEAIEKILYGFETTDPRLPLPDEVYAIISGS